MLTGHHQFVPDDLGGKNEFIFEVNWNPEDKKSNESKVVKITCPDGKASFVKRDDLLQFFYTIGTTEDKKKMIPQTISKIHVQDMFVGIKATKDIRKGEDINVKFKINIPCSVVDKIGEVNVERGMNDLPILGKYLK